MSDDAKRAGANAESEPLNLRIPLALAEELRRFAKTLPIVSKHRIAVEALKLGFASIQADPGILLRGAATPAQTAPAAPAAPSPVPVVASPAAPVAPPPVAPVVPVADSRQLPLLSPVALHPAADGHLSVARPIGNDNGVSPATPKPKRSPATSPTAPLDAAAVGARLRALRDDEVARNVPKGKREWSLRTAGERAGVSAPTIDKLMKGETVKPEYVAKVAAILPPE